MLLQKEFDFFHTAKVLEAQPMSCLWPLTRLSKKICSEIFMTFEKKISKKFFNGSIPASAYPNDEIFIAIPSLEGWE